MTANEAVPIVGSLGSTEVHAMTPFPSHRHGQLDSASTVTPRHRRKAVPWGPGQRHSGSQSLNPVSPRQVVGSVANRRARKAYHGAMDLPTRPLRIWFLGLLYAMGGVLAIWQVVEAGLGGTVSLNFAVFLLPVGLGLLAGKLSSLSWAKFWVGFGWAVIVLALVVAVIRPDVVHSSWNGRELTGRDALPTVFGVSAGVALILYGIWRLLKSQTTEAYVFASENRRRQSIEGSTEARA